MTFDQSTFLSRVCILCKAKKRGSSASVYNNIQPCVEVRGGWFKDRVVHPSATIMSWVNHTHYTLSGTTCRGFVGSLLGAVCSEYGGLKAPMSLRTLSGEMSKTNDRLIWGYLKYFIVKITLNACRCFRSHAHVCTEKKKK